MRSLALALLILPTNLFHTTNDSKAPTTLPSLQSSNPSESAPSAQPTMVVHRGSLAADVEAMGYFEPDDQFDVRIRPKAYNGELKIKSIAANGAKVKEGDVILEIDREEIDKQLQAAQNEDEAAHAAQIRTEIDSKIGEAQEELALRQYTDAAKRAKDEIKWFNDVDGPDILLQADQGVKDAKAAVDDQQDELNELKKMYKSDDLTTDTADIVVKRAVRNLENLKISLKITTEQSDKTRSVTYPVRKQQVLDAAKQAEQQLELLKSAQAQSRVLRATGLTSTSAATKAADQHLADLKADRESLTVCAPCDGVVLYGQFAGGAFQNSDERSLRPGEKIAPQQVAMLFYTPGKLRLHLDLPETKFFQMHPGASATITPVVYPDEKIEGTCDHDPAIDVSTQQGPQYILTIACKDVDSKLVPGMRADAHVHPPDSEIAVLVPTSAVDDGHVWVKTEDGIERRDVVVGKSDVKQTEIEKGLNEGDEILIEARK